MVGSSTEISDYRETTGTLSSSAIIAAGIILASRKATPQPAVAAVPSR